MIHIMPWGQSRPREIVPGTDLLTNLRAWRGRRVCSMDRAMTNNSDTVFPPAARRAQAQRGSTCASETRFSVVFPDGVPLVLGPSAAGLVPPSPGPFPPAAAPNTRPGGARIGFIKVRKKKPPGLGDSAGNRQYITLSNLAEN